MPASAQEILMLELINRARLDPAAEAARYNIDLNEGLQPGSISPASKQPLAWSNALFAAADQHSQSMIDYDYFDHVDPPGTPTAGSTPQSRANAAGYSGSVGENIAFRGSTGPIDATIMILLEHQDLFVDSGTSGRGHRLNILDDRYQQIGVGQAIGPYTTGGTTYNSSMVTEDFGIPATTTQFITGVVYTDTDHNDFYSVGEGLAGLNLTLGAASTSSETAGQYALQTNATGLQTITLTGGGLADAVTFTTTLVASRNIKLDVVDGHTLHTSASGTISGPITVVEALGVNGLTLTTGNGSETLIGSKGADILNGGPGDDTLSGNQGNDAIIGGIGRDTVVFTGARSDYAIGYDQASKIFTVADQRSGSPDGTDTVKEVEQFQFSDGIADANALTAQTVNHADGSKTVTTYDAIDAFNWSSYVDDYNAGGMLTTQTVNELNGTHWVNEFDPANAFPWSQRTSEFDAGGSLISQSITNDTGSHALIAHDIAGLFGWSQFNIDFDPAWNITARSGLHDDGSPMTAGEINAALDAVSWYPLGFDPGHDLLPQI